MVRRIFLAAVLAGVAGFGVFWWLTKPAVVAADSLPAYRPDLANGLTTFNAGGCSSCHAVPNQPDRLRLGGGLAIASPFGTFYVPNISPDPNEGIGQWTEALSSLIADRAAAARMGAAGRALAVARYSVAALAPRLAELLRRLA